MNTSIGWTGRTGFLFLRVLFVLDGHGFQARVATVAGGARCSRGRLDAGRIVAGDTGENPPIGRINNGNGGATGRRGPAIGGATGGLDGWRHQCGNGMGKPGLSLAPDLARRLTIVRRKSGFYNAAFAKACATVSDSARAEPPHCDTLFSASRGGEPNQARLRPA